MSTAREYARRRQRLIAEMGDGVAIIPTSPLQRRNRDVEYPYRPDSDFYYLTGFAEPNALAVLAPGRADGEFVLFCQPRDPLKESWTGRRCGPERAGERHSADQAWSIDQIDEVMPGLLADHEQLYYSFGNYTDMDQQVLDWVRQLRERARAGVQAPSEFISLDPLVHEMRLFKSAAELKLMRTAAKISATAHVRAMQVCRPGMHEYQIEAELLHEFTRNGARSPAYESIVGGGANGCILHYTQNDARLDDGDLLLIDAGAEYQGYAADITRTFPVNGRFSGEQRALYDLVLDSQLAAIAAVQPGVDWDAPHRAAVQVLTAGLRDLGILEGEVDALIEDGAYRPYYMHRTGHWLGMDVHDVGDYKIDGAWRMLEKGMVTTVEPGLYIAEGSDGVDPRWWNIGIRIEDDVLVTRDGHEILTGGVPKDAAEIEALMAG